MWTQDEGTQKKVSFPVRNVIFTCRGRVQLTADALAAIQEPCVSTPHRSTVSADSARADKQGHGEHRVNDGYFLGFEQKRRCKVSECLTACTESISLLVPVSLSVRSCRCNPLTRNYSFPRRALSQLISSVMLMIMM